MSQPDPDAIRPQEAQAGRRGPGRPKDGGDLRDSILDHAERAFAGAGYNGARMRDIAARAGVNQALIRYYFGAKQDLFDEVFRRRGTILAQHRQTLLQELLAVDPAPKVEAILQAYLKPQWDMKYSSAGGAAFVQLQARLHAEPEEHALRLRREVYDPQVRRYIDALHAALPQIPRDIISIRMAFLVGTYLFMLNDLGRLGDLTDGHVADLGETLMLDHLVRFLAAGMQAPIA
ncbi:TetR/AcrR family transcriptional regulator [Phaeovulum sp. W22_SRMD_FR3]|uniref:TetR/AcrR family transcriptional regulator n=1 Tax=Phaeovulum sp. W22_SRMD_FR3 TaxID=3240274 RepID=UPI003F9481AF